MIHLSDRRTMSSVFLFLTINLLVTTLILGAEAVNKTVAKRVKCSGGPPGPRGPPGPQGVKGALTQVRWFENWRQCAWNSTSETDYGEIGSCIITKQKSDSGLYVAYGANMRVTGCSGCCKRWYFTFNNAECSPVTIDGAVYQENTNDMNLHRHRNIAGYCTTLGAGIINVRVHVDDCVGTATGDAASGWNSASRIIVKEVPKSPYS